MKPLVRILFRRQRIVLLFFLFTMGIVTVVTLGMPKLYQSQAKLFLRLGPDTGALAPTNTLGHAQNASGALSREQEIHSVIEILQSRLLLEDVVDSMGTGVILGTEAYVPASANLAPVREPRPALSLEQQAAPERQEAIRELAANLEIFAHSNSSIIHVQYTASGPDLAQAVVTKLIASFLAHQNQFNGTPGAYRFLTGQMERLKSEITALEDRYTALKEKTGLYALTEQRSNLLHRIGEVKADLLTTNSALAATKVEVADWKTRLAKLPKLEMTAQVKGLPNEAVDSMRSQLYGLQLKELALMSKHPANHPEVLLIRKQVADAKNLLAKEETSREQTTTSPSQAVAAGETELLKKEVLLSFLRAKAEVLQTQVEEETAKLKELDIQSLELSDLERDITLREEHYRKYAGNLEQAQIDQALKAENISNVSIVQPASYEPRAVSPRLELNLALGFLFALVGGTVLALLRERTDSTIKTSEDVAKHLQGPPLVRVPNRSAASMFLTDGENQLWLEKQSQQPFQQVLSSLPWLNAQEASTLRVIGVTSIHTNEGVSTTCLGLAIAAASSLGQKVLLIDANSSNAFLRHWFSPSHAESDQVLKPSPVAKVPGLSYLWIGHYSARDPNTVPVWTRCIEELRQDYTLILMDLPPVSQPGIAPQWVSLVDGTLLVLEAEKTPADQLERTRDILEQANPKFLGVVLNKYVSYIPSWLSWLP